jgi:hypothetical protein
VETVEYRKLISVLDSQLDRAKQEAEVKARREQLETHIKLVAHQMEQLRTRKEQFEKLGVTPAVDLNPILEKLALDKASFEQQLQEPPPSLQPEKGVEQEDRDLLVALLREIEAASLTGLSQEERWLQIEAWAIRWRFLVDRVGQNSMSQDRLFSKVYATIRSIMDHEPASPYRSRANEPLTRPKPGTFSSTNWDTRMGEIDLRLLSLEHARRRDEEQARGIEKDMKGFSTAFTNHQAVPNAETDKALRHAIRTAARHVHLRPELAEALLPYRAGLDDEFSFLWDDGTNDDKEEAVKKTLTNRDIAARLLRRMKSKTMIGACHCPEDMISKGFPPHDMGRAKEIIDILVKAGVIRRKDNVGELRVSLEPPAMAQIDAFLAGAVMGIRDVDAWCSE